MEQNIPCGRLNGYLYAHWTGQLKEELSEHLGRSISYIDHYRKIRTEVSDGIVYYTFRLFAGEDEESCEDLAVTAQMDFYKDEFRLLRVSKYAGYDKAVRYGVLTDQNLVPELHKDELREKEAERFLKEYCPEAMETPMPVPIRRIMEEQMGLRIETGYGIPGENRFAFTVFEDQVYTLADEDGNEAAPYFIRGTVVVDRDTTLSYGTGMMNYSLAHEAYHWYVHRAYVDFHKAAGKQEDESYNGTSKYSAGEILEIQSNAEASRILMPRKTFIQKFEELSANESDLHKVIASLASFFEVSYTAVTYRLSALGLADFTAPAETDNVTAIESYALYAQDDFRKLVDSGLIVYTGGHYVVNDPKYVTLVWEDVPKAYDTKDRQGGPYRITDYAYAHPEEAFIRFSIDHRRIAENMEDGTLYRSADVYLRAEVKEFRKRYPRDARKADLHASRCAKLFEEAEGKHLTFCQFATLLILYRYGPMEDFKEKAKDRDWLPEQEMPEMAQWFAPVNRFVRELEKKRFEIWDSDEGMEVVKIIDRICTMEIMREEKIDKETSDRFRDNLTIRKYDEDTGRIADNASSPAQLFIADTHLPRTAYNEIINKSAGNPEIKKLMCLCIGMCLSPELSADLFASAGRILTYSKEDFAYRYVLSHMRGAYIYEVNAFLEDLGLDPIGANTFTGKDKDGIRI